MKVMGTNKIAIQWALFCLIYYIQCASALANKTAKQTVSNRMVNGIAATRHIPYIVSIQELQKTSPSRFYWLHTCGGSIIHENYVLSVAHCITTQDNLTDFSFYVGSSSRSKDGIRFNISSIVRHPDYTVPTSAGDIAILKTRSPFAWSNKVQKIEFRSNNIVGSGVRCVMSGWGLTDINARDLPDILQVAQVNTQPSTRCEQSFKQFKNQKQLCTLADSSGCAGDSGGPLTDAAGNLLIGVILSGHYKCLRNEPVKHNRVSAYVTWIENTLRAL